MIPVTPCSCNLLHAAPLQVDVHVSTLSGSMALNQLAVVKVALSLSTGAATCRVTAIFTAVSESTCAIPAVFTDVSGSVDSVRCFRHHRRWMPTGHMSSAMNTEGLAHTLVMWKELCVLESLHSSTFTSSFRVVSRYVLMVASVSSGPRHGTKMLSYHRAWYQILEI